MVSEGVDDNMIKCEHKLTIVSKSKPDTREEAYNILKSLYPDCNECVYAECGYIEDNQFDHAPTADDRHIYTGFEKSKTQEDEQLVFGWANWSVDPAGEVPFDWHGDIKAPAELEKAAYNFVLKYRATGENHEGDVKGSLVESMMFTKEKIAALGIPEGTLPVGWWVGFHVPDKEVFAKVKSGEYQMFSIQGKSKRVPIARLLD